MEIQYGISSIEETQFQYNYDFDYTGLRPDNDTTIQLGHELKVDTGKGMIIVVMNIEILASESKVVLARNTTRYSFDVEPFEAFYKGTTDKGIEISMPQLMNTFISIAIGSARGILAKNLKGTPLQGCILPLIPAATLAKSVKVSKN